VTGGDGSGEGVGGGGDRAQLVITKNRTKVSDANTEANLWHPKNIPFLLVASLLSAY